MSKPVRIIALAAAAVVVALIAGIYVGVLNTDAGRRAVLAGLKPTLDQSVNGEVRIGGTAGHWPHNIVLRNVTVADKEGIWLELPELSVRWNPLALINGRISIDKLTIPGGTLTRLPEDGETKAPSLPKLPKLPDLRLGALTIGPLDVGREATGRDTVLRVTGSADMRANLLDVSLLAETEAERPERADRAEIEIHWKPADDRLAADVRVKGPARGLIAQLAGIEKDGIAVSVTGTGPASKWIGAVRAELGRMGGVYGNLACDCSATPHLTLKLDAAPGPGLSENLRRYLGENPRIEAALFSPQASALTVDITSFEAPAGRLTRPLRITLTEGWRLLRFDISFGFRPGPALQETVPPWLGEAVGGIARGAFDAEGGIRIGEAAVASNAAQLYMKQAHLAGDGSLGGKVILRLLSAEDLPRSITDITGKDASLDFALAGNRRQMIRLKNVALATDAGTRATGELAYGIERQRVEADLDVTMPAPVFARVTGLSEPAGSITGTLSAEGPLDTLSATLHVRTPELALDPRPLPPAETILVVTGGLDDPRGRLTIRRSDDPKAPALLSADLAAPGREALDVSNLDAGIDGARLTGEARFVFETGRMTGNAQVSVPDLTALAADASGRLSAEISLETQAEGGLALSATANIPDARFGEYEARALEASASGPLSRLMVAAKAEYLQIPGIGPVHDLDTAGSVSAAEATEVTLSKLTAIVNDTAVALISPTQLFLEDGTVRLPAAAISWGEEGRVNAEALLTPEELSASLDITKAAIPGQSILATGSLKVNTGDKQPGALDLRLDPRSGQPVFVKLSGRWNGKTLDLEGAVEGYGKQAALGRNEILTASIPLTLSRTEGGFSISTEGDLDARLRYRGRLKPITTVFLTEDEQVLSGDLNADIRVSGPLSSPEAKGAATLGAGRYENIDAGIVLTSIDARLNFAGGLEAATGSLSLTAWDGRKAGTGEPPVMGDGQVTLNPKGLGVTADLRLREAALINRDDLDVTLTGTARLSGTFPKLALEGDVRIDRLDLLIPESQPEGVVDVTVVLVDEQGNPLKPEPGDGEKAREGAFELAMNVKIRSDGQAFIRGRGLDSEWKADMSVGGTLEKLELGGALTLKKGNLSFAGRRFDLTKGKVNFTRQSPPDPVLDIAAEHETDEGTRAIVRVSGRTSEPEITLDSTPPLPREQIMALVLFGKPVKELTALQALQVTNSLAQLTGTGPFGGGSIMDRARRTLGLDLLDLTFGKENGSVGLTVGRYLSEGIFVSASQDASGQGGKVSVEVEITDEFSVKTDVGQDASGNVTAQWKKDY